MQRWHASSRQARGLSRRELLQAGLAAGAMLSSRPLSDPRSLWAGDAGPPRRGRILPVRGYDPTHFDPHLTISFKTHSTLSFVYSRLVGTVRGKWCVDSRDCCSDSAAPHWLASRIAPHRYCDTGDIAPAQEPSSFSLKR